MNSNTAVGFVSQLPLLFKHVIYSCTILIVYYAEDVLQAKYMFTQ